MSPIPLESSKILEISLLIAQYPILASRIRRQMRQELFQRGIITPERFEAGSKRESHPLPTARGCFRTRTKGRCKSNGICASTACRRTLTDFYFAYNLPLELLQKIVNDLAGATPK